MQHTPGQQAETAAAEFLTAHGHQIINRNWRTRVCEIDIVSRKDGILYFVEVKYRSTSNQGEGLAYITPQKLQRMAFAAQVWVHAHNWRGSYELAVMSVFGKEFMITDFLTDL